VKDVWEEIGETILDLFEGDVICTDGNGIARFSTLNQHDDLSKAISVALKTGVRVSLVHDQRRVLVLPFDVKSLKGSITLIGYEFSEETLSIFVKDVIKEFVNFTEGYQSEIPVPEEVVEAFATMKEPILCAMVEDHDNDEKVTEFLEAKGGKFLKRMESGEKIFLFDTFGIEKAPEGCKIGISKDPRPDISYHEAIAALHYGSDPSGISSYSALSPSLLIMDILKDGSKRNAINDKLKLYPELVQTLKTFFENDVSPVKTAKIMKVHRNTILNRLNKIRDLTYLDPKIFKDGVILYLILMSSEVKSD
jgi:hypothetical protein